VRMVCIRCYTDLVWYGGNHWKCPACNDLYGVSKSKFSNWIAHRERLSRQNKRTAIGSHTAEERPTAAQDFFLNWKPSIRPNGDRRSQKGNEDSEVI
jgi:hypothetical protein